jgi:hypothetical protein
VPSVERPGRAALTRARRYLRCSTRRPGHLHAGASHADPGRNPDMTSFHRCSSEEGVDGAPADAWSSSGREPARTRSRRPQSACQRERCRAGRVWRNGSRNGVGSRHGHPHYCDRRSRHRSRHRRDPVRSLITFPLAVSEEYGLLKLALRPTVPARERYHANPRPARRGNAPLRQRGRLRGQCSAERLTARAVRSGSGERASELARIVRSASSRTRCRPRTRSGASAELCELRRSCAQAWPRGR